MGRLLTGLVWIVALGSAARSHELRPSLLALEAGPTGEIEVIWRVALARGVPLPLELALPDACASAGAPITERGPTVQTDRRRIRCAGGLIGRTVAVTGLGDSGTEVIARYTDHLGRSSQTILRAEAPRWTIVAPAETETWVSAYFAIGVEHIVFGPDHLLFLLGLLIVVGRRWRMLLATVTAFSVGHSITLAVAVLGAVRFPRASVEAIIALSILWLAVEIARERRVLGGRSAWLFALVCGLVHGLGFASALTVVGLPSDEVPLALLLFNLGVEAGQLGLIALALIGWSGVNMVSRSLAQRRRVAAYLLGVPAGFWFVQRLVGIVG